MFGFVFLDIRFGAESHKHLHVITGPGMPCDMRNNFDWSRVMFRKHCYPNRAWFHLGNIVSVTCFAINIAVHTVVSVANVSETNVSETMFRKHPNVYRALGT